MNNRTLIWLRKKISPFKKTVLHPQWLSFRNRLLECWIEDLCQSDLVLDIGCNDRWAEKRLVKSCEYVGLDYIDTSLPDYQRDADVYGDAQSLPFKDYVFDSVLLLDVYEHLPEPEQALQNISRVLRPGGVLIIQIPFMYPVHDAPFDFRRLTEFGLEAAFERAGFQVDKKFRRGQPLETALLLFNIALAQKNIDVLGRSKLIGGMLLGACVPVFVINNVLGWMASLSSRDVNLMPFSYQYKLSKK